MFFFGWFFFSLFFKIALLFKEPGSFIIGKVFIGSWFPSYWLITALLIWCPCKWTKSIRVTSWETRQRKKISIFICYARTSLILWKYCIFFGLLLSDTWEMSYDLWQIKSNHEKIYLYIYEKATRHIPGLCVSISYKSSSVLSLSHLKWFYWIYERLCRILKPILKYYDPSVTLVTT